MSEYCQIFSQHFLEAWYSIVSEYNYINKRFSQYQIPNYFIIIIIIISSSSSTY
jgi:hypothetical protein